MQILLILVLPLFVCSCLTTAAADVYVDKAGSQAPDGSPSYPYQQLNAALCSAEFNDTVVIQPGSYHEKLLVTKPIKLVSNGPVVIGNILGKSHTTIKVLTQNTHLFGDQAAGQLPQFADATRANLIAEKIHQENADVVALQEVWDPGLADAIVAAAGYPYHFYSSDYDGVLDFLNSGLLLLSKHALIEPALTYYDDSANLLDCAVNTPICLTEHPTAPWECLTDCTSYLDGFSSKGFMQASINKNGFQLGIFITHTQAEEHEAATAARKTQLQQLRSRIQQYLNDHPDAEVVAMGDFNVIGESDEYFQTLLPTLSLYDASRNMPCGDNNARLTCETSNELAHQFNACLKDQRLDYVLYSYNGNYDLMPTWLAVRKYLAPQAITDDESTAGNLSDHYGIAAEFTLYRD